MILYKRNVASLYLVVLIVLLSACKSRKHYTDNSSLRGVEIKGTLNERYGLLLGVPSTDIRNEKLYRFIDEWMGVPHQGGGMSKRGTDCSGFTSILFKEIYKKDLPRSAADMAGFVKRKYEEQLQEGDLVFFDFSRPFDHVGVYLKNNRFVHVSTSRGVIISNLKDPWYYKYFSRCGTVAR